MANPPQHVLELCSGIGGLGLGLRAAFGSRTVGHVERDAYAASVLLARMEDESLEPAPIWAGDLHEFDGRPWRGAVDCIAAGIPCQPWSHAGKQLGTEDKRHLGEELLRIVGEVGPRFVVVENVRGFVRVALPALIGGLADLGYDSAWACVRASDVGAPHRRERVFVLAYCDVRGCKGVGVEESRLQQRTCGHEPDGRDAELADAGGKRPQGANAPPGPNQKRRTDSIRVRPIPSGRGGAWPPGSSGDWAGIPKWLHPATEPGIRDMADGLPGLVDLAQQDRSDRLRCLGNAVVPAQAAYALKELYERLV